MSAADPPAPRPGPVAPLSPLAKAELKDSLNMQWRRLARAATFVALLASPALYLWFHRILHHSPWTSILLTAFVILAFRGLLDVLFHRFIPWPSLFGIDDDRMKEEDIVNRNRAWFWR